MRVRVSIVDGDADFRTLLMHHVSTLWSDAAITACDPLRDGELAMALSRADSDIVLLGSHQGRRDPHDVLRRFRQSHACTALVYFGSGDASERQAVLRLGADACFPRQGFGHAALTVRLADIERQRRQVSSTDRLFVGDLRTGIKPLIRGYRMIRKLSATEYSAVYLAKRESGEDEMALKVLRQGPEGAEGLGAFDRFLQEYELIAGLDHPGIVRIHDFGVSEQHAHLAMEYLPGGDLRERIASGLTECDAVSCLRQLASALGAIHAAGALHRDLKPGNIMFREDGSLAIIDFGLAKRMRVDTSFTGSGEIFGTPYYMSPEQGHADAVDARSDLYSLGVIFHEMLTGEKPYRADNPMAIIYKHTHAPIPLLPPRVSHFQALLNMLMAKDPEDRLASADEVAEWL